MSPSRPAYPGQETFEQESPLPFRLGSGFDTGLERDLEALIRRALAEAHAGGKDRQWIVAAVTEVFLIQ